MFKIEAIDKISAFTRVAEIQERIADIEKNFGFGIKSNDFQSVLEKEMAKQTDKFADKLKSMKPVEQFLAENKLKPVNENAAANYEKVAAALKTAENLSEEKFPVEKVKTEKPPVENVPAAKVPVQKQKAVETFEPPKNNFVDISDEELRAEIPNRETKRYSENFAPMSTEQMISRAARKYGVESELVKAVATAESNLNQQARSQVGAIGVMQLMPETAESLGVDPYDEKENIEGGAHYIRQMLDKFNGNVQHAVAAYNAGPGAVQKYGGIPPYSETQNYVGRVLDFYIK